MISVEVLVAAAAAANVGVVAASLRQFRDILRRRNTSDAAKEKAERDIETILRVPPSEGDAALIGKLIEALGKTDNAVVVVGNLAVIKDSATGSPTVVVRSLSPEQAEKINNNQAPTNDATKFHAWLDDTRPAETPS